jgi:hypothetical protein
MLATLARFLRRPDADDAIEDRDAARLDANLAALQQHDPDARIFPAGAFTAARHNTHAQDQLVALVKQYVAAKHTQGQMHLYSVLFDLD